MKESDSEIFGEQLLEKWEHLSEEEQRIVFQDLKETVGEEYIADDYESVSLLNDLLKDFSLQEISFSEWQKNQEEILGKSGEKKCLFLFDQDMTEEGGRSDEGILQISTLHELDREDLIFGILSNIGSIGEEIDLWENLAKEHQIPKDKFLYIHKARLHDPFSFARMVKLTAISKNCAELKNHVKSLYVDALTKADDEIEKIHIYDFEHIVFHHSNAEGIWEPEALFRMFNHYQREKVIEQAKKDEELNELAGKIREVSLLIAPKKDQEKPKHNSWKYRHAELYSNGDFLNNHHLPLELGDIFELGNSGGSFQKFVLLTQPCDVMVRSDGKRGAIKFFTLAKIEELDCHEFNEQSEDLAEWKKAYSQLHTSIQKKSAQHELEYFLYEDGKTAFVSLNRTFIIEPEILDFCVFNQSGNSTFILDEECPPLLTPSWKVLHKRIFKDLRKRLNRHSEIQDKLKNVAGVGKKELSLLTDNIFYKAYFPKACKGVVGEQKKSLSYPIKRIGRIERTKATEILSQFTGHLARTALDRDVGKEIH